MTSAALLVAAAILLGLPGSRAVAGRARHGRVRSVAGPSSGRGDRFALAAAVALAGTACLAVSGTVHGAAAAVVVCPLVWVGLDRLLRRPRRRAHDPQLPVALDLVAAGLRGGRPVADALARAAPAAGRATAEDLQRIAGLLRLGAEPAQAWATARDGPLAAVAVVAVRSAASGIRVAAAFEDLAGELRAGRRAAGAVRAHQAGTRAMGPLAACFLPSFVCLGIVPVVVGIARHALDVVP